MEWPPLLGMAVALALALVLALVAFQAALKTSEDEISASPEVAVDEERIGWRIGP
jgi:hypothetical protein